MHDLSIFVLFNDAVSTTNVIVSSHMATNGEQVKLSEVYMKVTLLEFA
jgi:hypothetical protein